MSAIINFLNVIVILLYILTLARFYNKHAEYFFSMLIILIFWTQLIVSSAYIETGVYLKDIGKTSYTTGVTIRLFVMLEIIIGIINYLAGKYPQPTIAPTKEATYTYEDFRGILFWLFLLFSYRLADMFASGNILTTPGVTRFNYFSVFSKLPFAQIIDYFVNSFSMLLGYIFLLAKKRRQKAYILMMIFMNYVALFLRGIEFSGYLQCAVYFSSPILITLARKRKLLRMRYAVLAATLLIAMLIPKYNHFSNSIKKGNADTSYGLNTAYDFLLYRIFAQEADLTWEIDRQVWCDGNTDPGRYIETLKGIAGLPVETSDTQYLMNRGCSASALLMYSYGTAVLTGGYPVLWPALFGYLIAPIFICIDAYLLFLVLRCICTGMSKQRPFLLLSGAFLLGQCHTVVISGNISTFGNLVPKLLIILLLVVYRHPIRLKMRNRIVRL